RARGVGPPAEPRRTPPRSDSATPPQCSPVPLSGQTPQNPASTTGTGPTPPGTHCAPGQPEEATSTTWAKRDQPVSEKPTASRPGRASPLSNDATTPTTSSTSTKTSPQARNI